MRETHYIIVKQFKAFSKSIEGRDKLCKGRLRDGSVRNNQRFD